MPTSRQIEKGGDDAEIALEKLLAARLSNTWSLLKGSSRGGIHAVYFRLKAGGIWVAVAKRNDVENNEDMVAFGQGRSICSALVALNASISAGKWKRDLPFLGRA